MEGCQVSAFDVFVNPIAYGKVNAQHNNDFHLEVLIGEGYQLQILSDNVTPVKDATDGNQEHESDVVVELPVLTQVLHEGSARVVDEEDRAL